MLKSTLGQYQKLTIVSCATALTDIWRLSHRRANSSLVLLCRISWFGYISSFRRCRLFDLIAGPDEVCSVDRGVWVAILLPERFCFFIERRRQLNPPSFFVCLGQAVIDISRVWVPFNVG